MAHPLIGRDSSSARGRTRRNGALAVALVDDLRLIRRRPDACTLPGRDQFSTGADLDAPPVTIEARRGWLSGTAGTAESDDPRVSMKVGSRMVSIDVRGDGTWSLATGGLEPGTHRVRASQFDAAGNEGRSAQATVTVDAPSPEPEPTAVPTASPPPPGPPPPVPVAAARCKVPKLRAGPSLPPPGRPPAQLPPSEG